MMLNKIDTGYWIEVCFKHQTINTKHQTTNNKHQTINTKQQTTNNP
jgi:hypothetical protein